MSEKLASLTLHNICKSFKQGNTICTILGGVSFEFKRGCSYAITGISGTGKSTLLHTLGGIEQADEGQLNSPHQKRIGFLFQMPLLIDELSVIENVMIAELIHPHNYAQSYDYALELLAKVGLGSYSRNMAKQLSGGEQQRVALARALFNKPDFIIADEPTAHLDKENAERVIELILDAKHDWGAGIIVASHDSSLAQKMDFVLTLAGGKLYGAAT